MQRRKQRGKVDIAVESAVEALTGRVLATRKLERLMKALTPEQRLAVLKNVAERIAALEREVLNKVSLESKLANRSGDRGFRDRPKVKSLQSEAQQ